MAKVNVPEEAEAEEAEAEEEEEEEDPSTLLLPPKEHTSPNNIKATMLLLNRLLAREATLITTVVTIITTVVTAHPTNPTVEEEVVEVALAGVEDVVAVVLALELVLLPNNNRQRTRHKTLEAINSM